MNYENLSLVNNKAAHCFELSLADGYAFIEYRLKDDKMYLVHTEVPAALQGKGVAAHMVIKALEYMDEQHLKLVPLCAYVKTYLTRHPEWNKLLDAPPPVQ